MRDVALLLLILADAVTAVSGLEAQARAALGGTVRDEVDGFPIGGATVSMVGGDAEVESSSDGFFILSGLLPGPVTWPPTCDRCRDGKPGARMRRPRGVSLPSPRAGGYPSL
jgi:hypothetical protein